MPDPFETIAVTKGCAAGGGISTMFWCRLSPRRRRLTSYRRRFSTCAADCRTGLESPSSLLVCHSATRSGPLGERVLENKPSQSIRIVSTSRLRCSPRQTASRCLFESAMQFCIRCAKDLIGKCIQVPITSRPRTTTCFLGEHVDRTRRLKVPSWGRQPTF